MDRNAEAPLLIIAPNGAQSKHGDTQWSWGHNLVPLNFKYAVFVSVIILLRVEILGPVWPF